MSSDFSRINTNLLSLDSLRVLSRSNRDLSKTQLRLATGLRINKAEDDSALFSISTKLNARISSLNQTLQNVSDAKSVMDIAEESLTSINNILFDVKRLVTKAANGAIGAEEREFIRQAINGFTLEVQRIAEEAQFNNVFLLDGSYDAIFQVGERIQDTISLQIDADFSAQDIQVSQVSTAGVLTSSGAIGAGTSLNALDQFEALQGGDQFDLVLTASDGTETTLTITASGAKGQLSTTTLGDLAAAINGTGVFSASFDSGALEVEEVTLGVGNALAVRFKNFVEAPSLDGATGTISFGFDAATGTLRSGLTASGAITTATNLNALNQFSNVEGGDQLTINLRDRDGTLFGINVIAAGTSGAATTSTVGDITSAITAQTAGELSASVVGGQIQITENNLPALQLAASAIFTENNVDIGAASVATVTFEQSASALSSDTLAGLTSGTALSATALGTNFDAGDQFDIQLRDNSGAATTITFTFATGAETVGDLIGFINTNSAFTASINGGQLQIVPDNVFEGIALDAQFLNFTDAFGADATFNGETFSESGNRMLSSLGDLSPAFNTATRLNDLSEFTNVQGGDSLQINLTDATGIDRSFTFNFAGSTAAASTSTIGDLITAINAQAGISASFDATAGALIIQDTSNIGNGLSFSFNNAGFTEAPAFNATAPTPPLPFSVSGNNLLSNLLTTGGVPAAAGTRLNNLDGFANLEGNDRIAITLRNRVGGQNTFPFVLNDVAPGQTSNLTVGDLANFIGAQSVGGVQFDATVAGGLIQVSEANPPNNGVFAASTTFVENNIDIAPKAFSAANFQISEFLRLGPDTGLVIGLGLVNFGSGSQLTQPIASQLLINVDDSISRVSNTLNQIGVLQSQLTNRELFLSQALISNNAAHSRIEDADFAREISDLIKLAIQRQFQIIALSQANLSSRNILGLL